MGWIPRTKLFKMLWVLLLLSGKALAQDSVFIETDSVAGVVLTDSVTSSLRQEVTESVPLKEFDEKRWENTTKDLDYSETIKKKKESKPLSAPDIKIDPVILKVVVISIVLVALIFLLYKIFGNAKFLNNQKVKTGDFSLLDEAEENLEIADLEKFLKDALDKKQYKLAVRIYYLMVLKELMFRNFIVWKKNKTNFEYLNEMRERSQFNHFHSLTKAFEIVWYGDLELEEKDFATLSPSFRKFIQSVQGNGKG